MDKVPAVALGDVAIYSDTKIASSLLTPQNYVGTDNILQNKNGKADAIYIPISGSTTEYKEGDILLANIRPYLRKIWYADNHGGSSPDVLTIRVNTPRFDPRFVYYALFRDDFFNYVMQGSKGSKMPRGDKAQIFDFPIPAISKPEQKRIANVLSSLDEKIITNNKIIASLEDITRIQYDYWFSQFDFPDGNGRPYKSSGGKMTWSKELKREIPEGWQVQNIGEIAAVKAGGDKPKVMSDKKTDYCSVPIYSNGIDNEGLYGFTNVAAIHSQSITISARGTIGYSVLRNTPFLPIIRLISVTPNNSYSATYLYEFFKSFEFRNTGSVQQQLTAPEVSAWAILCPDEKVLKKFNRISSVYVNKGELLRNENQSLVEVRDWLLPLLMNGQASVRDKTALNC
jgi:type I restriction enzyme S subunit